MHHEFNRRLLKAGMAVSTFVNGFDFRPGAIIERLGLLSPIYRQTTDCYTLKKIHYYWGFNLNGKGSLTVEDGDLGSHWSRTLDEAEVVTIGGDA